MFYYYLDCWGYVCLLNLYGGNNVLQCVTVYHVGRLKLLTVGIDAPWKSKNSPNRGLICCFVD